MAPTWAVLGMFVCYPQHYDSQRMLSNMNSQCKVYYMEQNKLAQLNEIFHKVAGKTFFCIIFSKFFCTIFFYFVSRSYCLCR